MISAFPRHSSLILKATPVIEKIPAQHLGQAEHKMAVEDFFHYLHTQPFAKFNHPLLMA